MNMVKEIMRDTEREEVGSEERVREWKLNERC